MTEDEQPIFTLKDILETNKKSEAKAGLVTHSDIEETRTEKEVMINMTFEDKDHCVCVCHPNKDECMECYQHPTHLKKKHIKTDEKVK